MSPAVGERLGPYEILGLIGAGGMGVVYKARDTRLDRTVAVKVLPPEIAADPERRARFQREARAASALNHPNICTIYDIGGDGRTAGDAEDFIAMEWIDGAAIGDAIPAGGRPIDDALELSRQIAAGMAAAHAAGIVHRDIKPANILLRRDGTIKIVDFGLARTASAPEAETISALTAAGVFMGTPGYASPEQVRGSQPDARTDVFAIGCVLYELFAGRRAFEGSGSISALAAVLDRTPTPLRAIREDVPRSVEGVVMRALQRAPEARYPSAVELLDDIEAVQAGRVARRIPLRAVLRRPAVAAALALLIVVLTTAGAVQWRQHAREQWVRGVAIPEAKALFAKGYDHHIAAFRLLRRAEALTPDDPQLRELMRESSTTVSVSTSPSGADVFVRDFRDAPDAWEHLGRSPVKTTLPAGTAVLWKVALDGFLTDISVGFIQDASVSFTLVPAHGAPPAMVRIPGGRQEFHGAAADLDSFWLDATEVTNRAFLDFVRHGGYGRSDCWTDVDAAVVKRLVDRTGRPGPSTWALGLPPEGQDDHPVAGVSWHEAAAYCRSMGKDLPTLYHWYYAAQLGMTTQWASLSNFQSNGTTRVGEPLHLNAFGTYDMAGNVREWTRTESRPGFAYSLGGSYTEPSYTFWDHRTDPLETRAGDFGFRCASYPEPLPAATTSRVASPFRDYRTERPASDELYGVLASLYDYDASRPLDARSEPSEVPPSSEYSIERVSFAAAYGDERVPAFLFLPRSSRPPFQVIVWYPGAGRFMQPSTFTVEGETTWFLFLVRSGRAVLFPEYKGTYERNIGSVSDPQVWRDLMVHSAKDLRRALDYLQTRRDIDAGRVAFYGLSMGAAAGGIMTAVEPRFRASVLLGGGLYPWKRPAEADIFNFLPRVRVPTLMINGRHDFFFQVDQSQQPMFQWLGTNVEDKKYRLYESAHIPVERDQYRGEMLAWLDRYLGPVSR
jgi:dienelactone hydrolase